MRFENDVILVIGTGTGMGHATAVQLINEGAEVYGYDLLDEEQDEILDEIDEGATGSYHKFVADINDAAKRTEIIEKIKAEHGKLDSLVYVAGAYDFQTPALATDDELWDYVMDVNVNSVFRMCREALPLLKDHEGKAANILIVGSVGGLYGSTAGAAYIASKHAVNGLARNLAYTYRPNNVRVNVVNPGSHITGITMNANEKWPDRDLIHPDGMDPFIKRGCNAINYCQMGEPEDVSAAICFLISEEAWYISGAQLTVDGGWCTF